MNFYNGSHMNYANWYDPFHNVLNLRPRVPEYPRDSSYVGTIGIVRDTKDTS